MLAMVLLDEVNSLDPEWVVRELKDYWGIEVNGSNLGEESSIIVIEEYQFALAEMKAPIPGDEVQKTAAANYLWENGSTEVLKHKSHVIVSLLNPKGNVIEENILFNKVLATVLRTTESTGIYMGQRNLAVEKEFYLSNSEFMSEADLPLYNWIYFGVALEDGKSSIYTYGLADFGKLEIEIIDSEQSQDDLIAFIYNLAHYVIAYDVTLLDGETVGLSAIQKIPIEESEGYFLEGRTLKLRF